MKKRIALTIGVLILAVFLLSGCDLLNSLFSTVTVEVTNNSGWIVEVKYAKAGTSDWQDAVTVYSTDNVETFDLPSAGSYDFRIFDWVSTGDHVNATLYDEDCTLDIGSVDYYMNVYEGANSVTFY